MPCKYDDEDWADLPEDAKEAAKVLGYTKRMWNEDDEPECCDEDWEDLTKEQQDAAKVLGYDQASWDSEGGGGCCVIS